MNEKNTFDDNRNKTFEEWKLPTFEPMAILKVKVICCRNVSVGFWSDMVDTPDPQVYLQCPDAVGTKEQNTTVKSDSIDAVWNEDFAFVLPSSARPNQPSTKPIALKVLLYDEDSYRPDDFLGAKEIDIAPMEYDTPQLMKLQFGTHGEVDIRLAKIRSPGKNFRYSLGLCDKEVATRRNRKNVVFENMKKMFANNHPGTVNEVANISIVGSGGGYRAYTSYAGAMEALVEEEIVGVSTDVYGLSGGAWYITSLMVFKGLDDYTNLREFHKRIKEVMATNLYMKLLDFPFLCKYREYKKTKEIYKQPTSFVDLYGYIIGTSLLGEDKLSTKLSDLQEYVSDGHIPFPIFTAIHVKNNIPASKFNIQVEMTPYEISLPNYAIHLPPETYGSQWFRGCVTRKCNEMPLHFLQGKTGSAFAIMFDQLLDGKDNETSKSFWDKFIHSKKDRLKSSETEEVSDVESEDEDEDDNITGPPTKRDKKEGDGLEELIEAGKEIKKLPQEESTMKNALKNLTLFKSRDFLLGRAATVLSFTRGLGELPKYSLNPAHKHEDAKTAVGRINTNKRVSQFIDSAMITNIPALSALRPQRNTNLLVVVDSTYYEADDKIDYFELVNLERLALKEGLKFPKVDVNKLWASSSQEFHILEDEEDLECPIVLWFTLCSTAFRNVKDYKRQEPIPGETKGPLLEGQKFNDFTLLGNPAYSTFKLSYTALEFERCKELMRYNMKSHAMEIKAAISRANSRRNKLISQQ